MIKQFFSMACITIIFMSTAYSNTYSHTSSGELEIKDNQGKTHTALLLDTAVSGDVNGMIANINVKQTFKNESDDWVNGRYVFPLPDGAAVDSLKIQIGERIIQGQIKEKEEAKRTFEQAKRQGKKAGLLQQHRPNLFSIAVANIGPHETIVADITFIDQVNYQNETFSLTLPTTITPRYIPGAPVSMSAQQRAAFEEQLKNELQGNQNVEISSGFGWATNTISVPDAAAITPPQTHGVASETSHRFSLDLTIKSGLSLQSVVSTSHPINYKDSGTEVNVALTNGFELMNSDLTLEWTPIIGAAPKAAFFQQEFSPKNTTSSNDKEFYSMVMLTPPTVNANHYLPRDITFIVDSSGSMAGQSMQQAKRALHNALSYLNSGDRFNVVDFDSQYRPLYSQSQNVSYDHLEQAKRMIESLDADGGTEMLGALKFALQSKSDDAFLKQIIFITDGSIGNENELFKLIHNDLGDARLFTVGIGSAPNSYFMNKAAKFGRGSVTTINDLANVQTKMAELFAKITKPILRDVEIDWPVEVQQFPSRIPDLYAGEPISVMVKSKKAITTATIKGSMLNTPWTQTLKIKSNNRQHADNLDTVWARKKVASLMDKFRTGELNQKQVKPLIVNLGINHHILTKFTAFVAVESVASKPQDANAKNSNVPNLMPKGSAMPTPNTATPATLLSLLGALMMIMSIIVGRTDHLPIKFKLSAINKQAFNLQRFILKVFNLKSSNAKEVS